MSHDLTFESPEVDRVLLHSSEDAQSFSEFAAQRRGSQFHGPSVGTQSQCLLRRLQHHRRPTHHPHLIEQIDAVAQRPGCFTSNQAQRFIGNLDAFRFGDRTQSRDHVVDPDSTEIEALATAQDRRFQGFRIGGREDKDHMRRRLFQRLQQRIGRRAGELMDFIDQVHLESRRTWPIVRTFA